MTQAGSTGLTALENYAKLEAPAQYITHEDAEPREIILGFGARSLMIVGFDERAIAHWPLASLVALVPADEVPLVLAPSQTSDERIVLSDADMIQAIETVCPDLHGPSDAPAASPKRGRRWPWAVVALILLAPLAVATARVDVDGLVAGLVEPITAAELGGAQTALVAQAMGNGRPVSECTGADGRAALQKLLARVGADRLQQRGDLAVFVLDTPQTDALALPGGIVVITRGMLATAAVPEEVAGVLAMELAHETSGQPLMDAIAGLDLGDKLSLVSGAPLDAEAQRAMRDALMASRVMSPATITAALIQLDQVGLPRQPFQALMADLRSLGAPYALRREGIHAALKNADPGAIAASAPFAPALGDRDWLALGTICEQTSPLPG